MATVNREKRFNTAQGILYLLADGDNCIEICSAEETIREFEVESIEERDLFFDFCAINLFVHSAKGLLSDPDRFWEVIEKIEEADESKDFTLKDEYVIKNEGLEYCLPKINVAYQVEGVDLTSGDYSLTPGGFTFLLPNGENLILDFYRHYGDNISETVAEFTLTTLEVDFIVQSNDYFPSTWDELHDAILVEAFLDAHNNKDNTLHGTEYGAKVTKFEVVSEDDLRIYYSINNSLQLESVNSHLHPSIIDRSQVIKSLSVEGFRVEQIAEYYNEKAGQIITTLSLSDQTPISHFKLSHGKGYYVDGEEQHANVYLGPTGGTKFGISFKSLKEIPSELKKIESLYKEEYQS